MTGIFEIGRILAEVNTLTVDAEAVNVEFVKSRYEQTYYAEQNARFDDVVYAASCLNLLVIDGGNEISLSTRGHKFISLISSANDTIILNSNKQQRQFLIECMDAKCIRSICGKIFKKFQINYANDPPKWYGRPGIFNNKETYILMILEDMGIVSRLTNYLTVEPRYMELFSSIRNGINIDEILERKKQIGEKGENLTMIYETNRLAGLRDLAHMIEQTSLVDSHAGYDIASFDGAHSKDIHDRFIEVKATTSRQPKFYCTRNEVCKAKEYGAKYWIYLWTDVDRSSRSLHMIQNPYVELFETGKPVPKPTNYLVDRDVLAHVNVVVDDSA